MANAVYLDHNATSPIRPEAYEAACQALRTGGNPTSVHQSGRTARALVEKARAQVADLVGAEPSEIIFTSGGTEANNLVLHEFRDRLVFVSAIEHDSILKTAAHARRLPVGANGILDLKKLTAGLREDPVPDLVSIMAANNETGILQPLDELSELVGSAGSLFHCDAVQAAGKTPLSFASLSCDFMTLSAHKIGGPTGIGALVLRRQRQLRPLLFGGSQEQRMRAGTENLAGIAGFGAAAAAAAKGLSAMTEVERLRNSLEQGLREITPDIAVFGAGEKRLPNTACFALPGTSAETLLMALDLDGISVSSGAACSSGKVGASHVLLAMGVEEWLARAALRVSLGWNSTSEDISRFLDSWRRIAQRRGSRKNAAG